MRSRFWTTVTALALAVCVGLVAGLGWLVLRQIHELETASSDNLQWTLSQAEVEYLKMARALERGAAGGQDLAELRRRFDIFYSRVSTLESSQAFDALRSDAGMSAALGNLRAYLDSSAPFLDGSDEALRSALPRLAAQAAGLEQDIRAIGLTGLSIFAERSDSSRHELIRALVVMTAVLGVLLCGLVLLAGVLLSLARTAAQRSRDAVEAAARLRGIVSASLDAIVVTDAGGIIREFNPAAERIFGHARAEALGQPGAELLPPETSGEIPAERLPFAVGKRQPLTERRTVELAARHRSGRIFPAEFSISRADRDDGHIFVSIIRDISRRKAAEADLTQARDRALDGERAKGEFLAVMSHEMRTPLNGLLGTMQLLRDHSLDDRQTELLDRMEASGQILLGLVNDVLDLSKLEAGKMRSEKRPFSVAQLADGVIETAAPLAAANGNSLSWSWAGPPAGRVLGDPQRLRQILLNLMGNAIKFTHGGSVELEIERTGTGGQELEFRVIDTGIGIAEEHLERIFEDFETLDSSYSREAGGTGLGLGIARRMARLLGGRIGVESEPGEGSLFWLRLPAEHLGNAEEAAGPGRPARPAVREPLDLLLVEDNEINRFVARTMLETDGHRVTEAVNGKIGVELAAGHRFDAILMDISMPEMDGPEATRTIRSGGASAQVPIIAVTAHALPEEVARFHDAGMDACISKPIERNVLLETLSGLAARRAPSSPSAEAPEAALVDRTRLDALEKTLQPEGFASLMARFAEEAATTVARIAGGGLSPQDLAATAHRISGICAVFGLDSLRNALGEIETAAKTGRDVPPGQLDALRRLWEDSSAQLGDWSVQAREDILATGGSDRRPPE